MEDLIIKINRKTRQVDLNNVSYIGNDHENLQENIIFQFEDEFVNGQARLEYEINGTKNYIILEKVAETYQIPVKNAITIYQERTLGKIQFQLVITEGTAEEETTVFKSNIFYLRCRPSINAVTEAPEGYELWIEQANAKLNQMDNLDIDVEKVDDVATVTITKKDGTVKEVEMPKYDDTDLKRRMQDVEENKANSDEVPRKLSELENDEGFLVEHQSLAGYATENWVENKKYAKKTELPDVSEFITKTVNNLTNYYIKTDTYTKQEVNDLIGQIQSASILVVEALPEVGKTNVIYFVPKEGVPGDIYNEYVYVNSLWEFIGNTQTDLAGYAKETWVNQQISDFLTQSQIEELVQNMIENKQDTLISGENIKTINGKSILGEGDMEIQTSAFIGATSDYSTEKRLNLNNIPIGKYMIMARYRNVDDNLFLEATYNGVHSTLDILKIYPIRGTYINCIMLNDLANDNLKGKDIAIFNYLQTGTTGNYVVIIKTISIGDNNELVETSVTNTLLTMVTTNTEQNITAKKTFTTLPESSVVPKTDNQLTNKKYVDDSNFNKQEILVSGENIKTLNGESILGEGNLNISGTRLLGHAADYSASNYLNLNSLEKGVYELKTNQNGSGINYDALYIEMTYNGHTSRMTPLISSPNIPIPGTSYVITVSDKIEDSLPNGTKVVTITYIRLNDTTGILRTERIILYTDSNSGARRSTGVLGSEVSLNLLNKSQTISAKKTFTVLPESSVVPSTDNQLVNKKYVDDTVGNINTALEAIINGGV